MNDDLKTMHDECVAQVGALSQAYDATNDRPTEKVLATEIAELTHRINILQSLLFVQASAALSKLVPAVQTASQQLTTALATLADLVKFINAASTFLTYVDQAIDLAKQLGLSGAVG